MGSFLLTVLLFGLQVNHTMFAENLNGDFRYCISEISHPYINGDTKVCFYFKKSFNVEPTIRACVPTICTNEYKEYYVDTTEYHTYVCIWFWKHHLKTMKVSFEIFFDDGSGDFMEIKE